MDRSGIVQSLRVILEFQALLHPARLPVDGSQPIDKLPGEGCTSSEVISLATLSGDAQDQGILTQLPEETRRSLLSDDGMANKKTQGLEVKSLKKRKESG